MPTSIIHFVHLLLLTSKVLIGDAFTTVNEARVITSILDQGTCIVQPLVQGTKGSKVQVCTR